MLSQGISNTKLEYDFLKSKPTDKSRYGLFRVENNYNYKNDVFTPSDELTSEKVKEDLQLRKVLYKKVRGTPVNFGDFIQLRHMHSGGYLTLGDDPGNVPGSWEAHISIEGSERSCIRFLPKDFTRRIGDMVRYCDQVIVSFSANIDSYLCAIQCETMLKIPLLTDSKLKIAAYHRHQGWEINFYETQPTAKNLLRYGVPIILQNKRTRCNLTAEYKSSVIDSERSSGYRVFLSKSEHDFNKYWIFENTECFVGGKIPWKSPVFIRNVTLEGYLTSELTLSDVPITEFQILRSSPSQFRCVEITSELILQFEDSRISSNDVDPRHDILSKMIPVKQQYATETSATEELIMQPAGSNKKLAIFEIQPLRNIDQEVTMQLTSLVRLFENYC